MSGLIAHVQRSAADEHKFVEGAGAYLGLLLLDHLPAASHVANSGEHRLRVGRHGFFDPFAAVAHALEAADAPRALIDAVKRAEAEAEGSGPTARVVSEVLGRLASQPALRVLGHFDHKLWLEIDGTRMEIDLARVIAVTQGEPKSVLEHAVARLCA